MSATARDYLVQQLSRLRVASNALVTKIDHLDQGIKEVKCDLILTIAALDDLEDESKKDAAA